MNPLLLCALLVGDDPEPEIDPTFVPKLKWTIPAVGGDKVVPADTVGISPDGSLVAGGFQGPAFGPYQFAVYDRKTGTVVYRADVDRPYYRPISLVFSRDNRYLAASLYRPDGDLTGPDAWAVYLIDLKDKTRVKKWEERALAFSPTADMAYLTKETHIEGLELPGLTTVKKFEVAHVTQLAVSSDGKTLAGITFPGVDGAREELVVLDTAGGVRLRHDVTPLAYSPKSLAFSPDGRRIATSQWRGEVKVWSAVEAGKPQRLNVDRYQTPFPLWFDNDTLGLFLPDREYTRSPGRRNNWTDMYLCDLSRGEPEAVRWRFENAPNEWSTTGRYALSADRQRLVAACNGMSVIDLKARQVERTFPGWREPGIKK